MRVANMVTISVGEFSPNRLSIVGRPEIEPQIIEENIPPTLRSAIDRVGISTDELFSYDVSGHVTLRLEPGEQVCVLEGTLQIYEEFLRDIVHRSVETVCDSAQGLAQRMQPGQLFVYTVCYGAEQFQQAA